MNSGDYKTKFGKNSLASPEYKAERKEKLSGENNPMFGRNHTDIVKEQISKINKGKAAHNKGKKVTDELELNNIRERIKKREETYKETGYHPRKGAVLDADTKIQISNSVKKYVEKNRDKVKERAKKSVQTKTKNNYFIEKKNKSKKIYDMIWRNAGYEIVSIDTEYNSIIKHTVCNKVFDRNLKSQFNANACTTCFPISIVSKGEAEIANYLQNDLNLEIITNSKLLLDDSFEIDIFIPSHNICIEYNGLYWHSEKAGKSKFYHSVKTKKCKEKGYRLIHIFEDEWIYKQTIVKERLKSILQKNHQRIYARKCSIEQISISKAREFHVNNHIQGYGMGTIAYALKFNDTIVAVMDFGPLSKSKGQSKQDNVWELTRFSTKGTVVGGASKLFYKFLKDNNPLKIISYSDIRWNTGSVYEKLGFKNVGNTLPGYWYVKGTYRYHRFKFRKDKLVKEGADKNLSEKQIMINRGYTRIWDCGHDKWEWNLSTPIHT